VSREPDPELAGRAQVTLRQKGVLVGRGGRYGNVLILAPPLVIEEDVLDSGFHTIVKALEPEPGARFT
jgi:4-aminobutyrate aminotransferase